jgi:CheY-like chemotaxis protein
MKILLVDDEPALRELLRATFEGADVSVDEAESGLEAEARIRRRRPDVIVLDLRMPVMDGVELCKRLKADPKTSQIPIVLLTGADPDEARRAQRAGAAALVRKTCSRSSRVSPGGRRCRAGRAGGSPPTRNCSSTRGTCSTCSRSSGASARCFSSRTLRR